MVVLNCFKTVDLIQKLPSNFTFPASLFICGLKQTPSDEGSDSSWVESTSRVLSETQWHPFAYCYPSLCTIKSRWQCSVHSLLQMLLFDSYSFSAFSDPRSGGLSPTAASFPMLKDVRKPTQHKYSKPEKHTDDVCIHVSIPPVRSQTECWCLFVYTSQHAKNEDA